MARKTIKGLVSIEFSDIAGDGGVGTDFAAFGSTVKDSMTLNETDPTTQEFFVEEEDDPIDEITTQKGVESFAWSCYDVNPDNLILLFGGTKSGTGPVIWTPPATQPEVEQSIRVTDRKGNIMTVVRAKITAKKNFSFQGSKLGQIDIVAKILVPEKANTAKYTLSLV